VSGFWTLTLTAPAAAAGVTARSCVALTKVVLAAEVPKDTTAPLTKFDPLIVTVVPPVVGPEVGDTAFDAANAGAGAMYVNPFGRVADCVSGFWTLTLTAPAAAAGVVAVSCVALTKVVLAAAVPKDTTAPLTKLEPLIVTLVPPDVLPVLGETGFDAANAGAGWEAAGAAVTDF
jgi:hypothetical protein